MHHVRDSGKDSHHHLVWCNEQTRGNILLFWTFLPRPFQPRGPAYSGRELQRSSATICRGEGGGDLNFCTSFQIHLKTIFNISSVSIVRLKTHIKRHFFKINLCLFKGKPVVPDVFEEIKCFLEAVG